MLDLNLRRTRSLRTDEPARDERQFSEPLECIGRFVQGFGRSTSGIDVQVESN